jgi:hypothetical protein
MRGADIVHVVRNNAARECGKILWETPFDMVLCGASNLLRDRDTEKRADGLISSRPTSRRPGRE